MYIRIYSHSCIHIAGEREKEKRERERERASESERKREEEREIIRTCEHARKITRTGPIAAALFPMPFHHCIITFSSSSSLPSSTTTSTSLRHFPGSMEC